MTGMDKEYVWCSRINSAVKYRRRPGPFSDASAIGLDFDVAFERKTKLDLSVLTNGAMLDIYDFGKVSEESFKYLLSDILVYNFVTGMDNDEKRRVFAQRLYSKIGLLKRYEDKVFSLPSLKALNLSVVSKACPPSTHMSESSDKSAPVTIEWIQEADATTESFQVDLHGETNHVDKAKEFTGVKGLYPRCDAIGLDLYIKRIDAQKQKLDPQFLTCQVIFEVMRFVRKLCGTKMKTFFDVLHHNFDLSGYKNGIWQKMMKINQRSGDSISLVEKLAFRAKPCTFVHSSQIRKRTKKSCNDNQAIELPSKRRKMEPKPIYDDGFCDSGLLPHDELNIFGTRGAEFDSKQETQAVEQSETTFKPPAGPKQHIPAVAFSCSSEEEAPPSRPHKDVDIGAEEHKLRLWKRRALRSWKIIDLCFKNKQIHLDFDIGAGPKSNANLKFLTIDMLQDLFKFANRMCRTRAKFTQEIFRNNFRFDGKALTYEFLVYITFTMKKLVSNGLGRSSDFLSAPFDIPDHYNVGIPFSPASEEGTQHSETLLNPGMAKYPLCGALGVNFWAVRQRPLSEKLELSRLTNGAMLEVSSFIQDLCGNGCELMYEVLAHNFYLDPKAVELRPALKEWFRLQKESKGGTQEQNNCFERIVEAIPNCNKEYRRDTKVLTVSKRRKSNRAANGLSVPAPKRGKPLHVDSYPLCKELQINLDMSSKGTGCAKLDLNVLTRAAVYEIYRYVMEMPQVEHYIPALFRILEDNFDLTSQFHRRFEFAQAIASQVRTMAGNFKSTRKGNYVSKVFELPFEFKSSGQGACKEEREAGHCELEANGDDDIEFVCKLVPVDIEIELD